MPLPVYIGVACAVAICAVYFVFVRRLPKK
jgi:hypothetical protein